MSPSKIEWTEETWNPVLGCTHVSEGCDNCYAARESSGRLRGHPLYAGLASGGKFTGEVRLVEDRLDHPLRWKKPRIVFVNSMSDLFHDGIPDGFIGRVFNIMGRAEQHTFQVLTKRPGRMASLLTRYYAIVESDPYPNVWLGTSVETQKWADVRIPQLLRTPAAIRFLSCEPLLGPVDLGDDQDPLEGSWIACQHHDRYGGICNACGHPRERRLVDWVIAGGESGPAARPTHPDWIRELRDDCVRASVPFFFKQWGEWVPLDPLCGGPGSWRPSSQGRWMSLDPGATSMVRLGKKAAGRELDGRKWDEMPHVEGSSR